jgi:hypothetical protein
MEVLLLMYDIVRCVSAHTIQQDHHFDPATISDWAKPCREVMLDYVLAALRKSAVQTILSKSTTAGSVGASAIGDTKIKGVRWCI